MSNKRNVTFIGLGTMGYPMAGHLSKSSLVNLRVFNRTMEKALKWNEEFEGEVVTSLEQAFLVLMLLLLAQVEMRI